MNYGVKNLSKSYGELVVLKDLTMEFPESKVTCILGPSGCGKTTLLNIVTGAIGCDSGEVIGFDKESMSFIFQEDRLIQWRTVEEILEFVLKGKMSEDEIKKITTKYLRAVGMEEYRGYYPNKLSGGMRQRVAIIRAFMYPSKVLIMDEPFKSLDSETKRNVVECFRNLMTQEKRTTILVTHDMEEAKYLADTIITLSGRPAQIVSKES